ncbi:MAG: acyltransferase [Spirochaetaceae bacterium]|nr:MAG: acyltransferase [Spirochaetaceae bacterium]
MKSWNAAPVTRARRDVSLADPGVRGYALAVVRFLAPAYLRWGVGCRRVRVIHPENLVTPFASALDGKTKLIIAFRHPFVDEPQILSWLFFRGIRHEARRLKTQLPRAPHAVFVHGYEVPRWSGALVRWIMPRLGAMPVHHSKMDSNGISRIRRAIIDGGYPVALAPEGQVGYSSETVPRLESGALRLGYEAASMMNAAGRNEPVVVLPLSVHRRYRGRRPRVALERLIRRTEKTIGIDLPATRSSAIAARLNDACDRILGRAEALYLIPAEPDLDRDSRVARVVVAAVTAGERILGIPKGHGEIIERVYRIRQIGWDRIYVSGDPGHLTPLDRAIADRAAGEAWYAMRHMELADFAWYFRTTVPAPDAPFHSVVEYAQNLWDFANRLAGGAISGRVTVRPFDALIVAGTPLDLTARMDEYRSGKKAAVARALDDLKMEYERCIEEARLER